MSVLAVSSGVVLPRADTLITTRQFIESALRAADVREHPKAPGAGAAEAMPGMTDMRAADVREHPKAPGAGAAEAMPGMTDMREADAREHSKVPGAEAVHGMADTGEKFLPEDYDILNLNKPIERRSAARILHRILTVRLGEADQADWSTAERLRDLYSCHSCVNHIAQVYVKGIMPARRTDWFDLTGHVTCGEAAGFIACMADRKKRVMPQNVGSISCEITPGQAHERVAAGKARLIDVRPREEYAEGHLQNAESIPIDELIKNPHRLGDKSASYILYCQNGCKSRLAAGILKEAGFREVYSCSLCQREAILEK